MKVKILNPNKQGTDYFVGDIQGEYHKLMGQLNTMGFDESKDRLIAVGDLIDRGEENLEILGLLHKSWFFSVKGNHEQMLLDSMHITFETDFENDYADKFWISSGGQWAFDLKPEMRLLLEREAVIINELPNVIQIGDIGVVHAECSDDDWNVFKQSGDIHNSLWSNTRKVIKNESEVKNIKAIVVGHTPIRSQEPLVLGNHIYIDSGAISMNSPLIIKSYSEILSLLKQP